MGVETETMGKLANLLRLYQEGYRSQVIDQAVDKLIRLEVEQSQAEMQRLRERLSAYEEQYHLSSQEFYQRFQAGELGDEMEYVEWSVFWDMYQAAERRLAELTA